MNLLGDLDASVVIIPGNHDVHDERTLWGTHADHEHRLEVTGAGVIFLDDPEGATLHFDEQRPDLVGTGDGLTRFGLPAPRRCAASSG